MLCFAFRRIKHNLVPPYALVEFQAAIRKLVYLSDVQCPATWHLRRRGFSLYVSLQYKYYTIFSFICQEESIILILKGNYTFHLFDFQGRAIIFLCPFDIYIISCLLFFVKKNLFIPKNNRNNGNMGCQKALAHHQRTQYSLSRTCLCI